MNLDARKEVLDFMRHAERLIQLARMDGGLKEDECDAIVYYAREIEREVLPQCSKREESACS
jgi:hypothetical protein